LLAEEFTKVGGKLQEKSRWTGEDTAEGLVRASGRRSQATENGGRWSGLKVHARNVKLIADLEMHLVTNGYVGICQVAADVVNVCGLFRRTKDERMPTNWRELLRSVPGTSLHRTMASAEFDESSSCAVAGLAMRPRKAAESDGCCVGDAITMIPPVTGNGMSMAFKSAHHALRPLIGYSQGKLSWRKAREMIAERCDAAFHQRLTWARWLQWMMFSPLFQNYFGAFALRSEFLWHSLFRRTR
jgi:flavin-dependent dehydrogenase